MRLSDLTTLRVGGPAAVYVEAETEVDLVEAVREADSGGAPALVLGGGSNLLVADAGYPGTVVAVRTRGVEVAIDDCSGVWLEVAAGEPWDDLVARAVSEGWAGLEALSGIPGLTGATPIQNVGAYGQQVSDTLVRVRAFDRTTGRHHTFAADDCQLAYRTSRFKTEPGRYVVLTVTFQLRVAAGCESSGSGRSGLSEPVQHAELAGILGVVVGERAPLAAVREAVLALRRGKGMVLDPADHDTWSAGSFFTNPVLDPADVPAGAPRFPQPDGRVKTSAAWLIEHAGFSRGHRGPGDAAVSNKHTLALTNRGAASCTDLLGLASELRAGVRAVYGITLAAEPVLVGAALT